MLLEVMEPYIQKKSEEYLLSCCEKRKAFYKMYVILYQEARLISPPLAEAILEIEELMVESIDDIKAAYKAGYIEATNVEHKLAGHVL